MLPVAQTNLQLYNQMRLAGRQEQDFAVVRAAYDLACLLYSGYYQADGKPFVAHSVGVASILCHLGLPGAVIGFGLVHNVYGNGDFGDGLLHRAPPRRRRLVREAAGEAVEALVFRFRDFRVTPRTIDRIEAELDGYGEADRHLVLTDLADHLEKYVDQGVLYFGDAGWVTGEVAVLGDRMIALADRLGQPTLAEMMRDAFSAVAEKPEVPAVLRRPPKQKYLAQTMPLSARQRLYPRLASYVRRKLRKY